MSDFINGLLRFRRGPWEMVASILIASHAFLFQAGLSGSKDFQQRFAEIPLYAAFHVLGSGVALLIGGFQFLPKLGVIKRGRAERNAHPAGLEQRAVLIAIAGTPQVHEQFAVLDPDIEANVPTGNRHRLPGVLALRGPDNVVLI